MARLQQWLALTAVAVLAVLAAGWFLLIAPKRADAADLRAQTQATTAASGSLRTQLATLQTQARDLPGQQARLAAIAVQLPSEPALPGLIRALTAAAASAGVEFISVAPGTAAPPTTATAGTAAPATGAGLLVLPVTINVLGDYFQVEQYLVALEALPRAFRVTNLLVVPGTNPVLPVPAAGGADTAGTATDGRSLLTTVTGSVYLSGSPDAAASTGSPAASVPAK